MSLKKLADLATKMDTEGKTKAASVIDAAMMKLAQEFPDFGDLDEWEGEGPTDEELMRMETDPEYDPHAGALDEAKASKMQALMTEMALFDEAVRSGELRPEDKETWDKIQAEFGELMASMSGGFSQMELGSPDMVGGDIAEA
jgi:hypothetical protein